MKIIKKVLCIIFTLLMILPAVSVFADDEPADGPTTQIAEIDYLDTSAIDGKLIAYKGIETYFVIYPFPEESESKFDIYKAIITVEDDSIVKAVPDKEEQYRFGSVKITGLKLGKTTVTVTEPESGKNCSVEVSVLPGILYRIQNFFMFIEYIPYFIGIKLLSLLNREKSIF